ncbi:hypothetical protein [Oscillatoria acuminata]|uniref:Uncharacterized protein n=1 Tax=Oscillatoria acuminata PCC 6304 TaxID=56110 RepID=K9TEM3_9CYAN|nr:hypothetical protein [Oscillatoria acuminata]AFY80596.1 hypothetical protein Oscil6304_0863 [Oscillatoria acuminata PCC 6304]
MVNQLSGGNDGLQPVDYSYLLQQILRAIQGENLFKLSGDCNRLRMDIDGIAAAVAMTPGLQNPLTSANGVRSASVKFTERIQQQFSGQIQQIQDQLRRHLQETMGSGEAIAQTVDQMSRELTQVQGTTGQLGFTFNFNQSSPPLQKEKLRLETNRPGSESRLKFHKITLSVQNVDRFSSDLRQGIANYITTKLAPHDEEMQQELLAILDGLVQDEFSYFDDLQQLVDTESLGKLKKEAKIIYLEHLAEHIETSDTLGMIYLNDLIRRLRSIDDYINDSGKADGDFEVNYGGVTVNYRDALSRAEVFDCLPIIPIIDGNLGEHTDREGGERQFIFGLKLKFGGPVQTHAGQEVLDYNLMLLDPEKDEHKEAIADETRRESFVRKVLVRLFIYYFVFASDCDPGKPDYNPDQEGNFDPWPLFDERVMPVLSGSDEVAKQRIFAGFIRGMNKRNVRIKIERLRSMLQNVIKRQKILPTRTYSRKINLRKGILQKDVNSALLGYFLDPEIERNPKAQLKYVTIEKPGLENTALCRLEASIKIEDIRYFPETERERFTWNYQIAGIRMLAVVCTPNQGICWQQYRATFRNQPLILLDYDNTRLNPGGLNPSQTFIYRFTWTVLAYICFDLLLEKAPKNLFIPFLRLHEGTHERPFPAEKFLANLCKGLSYLLSHQYRSNSQGIRLQNFNRHRLENGLRSLYSVLPKTFRVMESTSPLQLDKLAVAIVSSRESDAATNPQYRKNRIANVTGEIIGIQRSQPDTIQIERLQTFSDNYSLRRLYREPPILIDTVNQLYQQGYRHILYVAQAPYTSTLNITRGDRDEDLYFMSPPLITALMKNHPDLKIYPIFFDKYYVCKLGGPKVNAFVVQDTQQLTSLAQDPRQQAVVFLNLFNGISVGRPEERFYNGVISYSTLLGDYYPQFMDDQSIRQDLIYDTSLKRDILQYLTLFHFSRFDRKTDQTLKLDPYETIIGEQSIGALSIFEQMTPRVEFNALAFLTEVKKVLDLRRVVTPGRG